MSLSPFRDCEKWGTGPRRLGGSVSLMHRAEDAFSRRSFTGGDLAATWRAAVACVALPESSQSFSRRLASRAPSWPALQPSVTPSY